MSGKEEELQKLYIDVEDISDCETDTPSRSYGSRSVARPRSKRNITTVLVGLLNTLLGIAIGLLIAKLSSKQSCVHPAILSSTSVIPEVPLGDTVRRFEFNESFARVPQKSQREPEWDSLLPNGLGYLHLEDAVEKISVVSVFHQLHCLYTLRRAFFSTTGINATGNDLEDFDFDHDRSKHVRHCFEYLRLSLMCNADSHIEPVGDTLNANEFLGWNTTRKCRDYEQLKSWTESRRVFDANGFLAHDIKSRPEKGNTD